MWWVSVYHVWVLATQYIAPVLVMAYCYAMMAITIWRNKDLVNAEVSLRKCYYTVLAFAFQSWILVLCIFCRCIFLH